jgi:PucR family transcriptional regulator, purine catabolism regulatory protein
MHLTIKDVLQMFQGQSLCLTAGSGGIDNPVASVNIMDAPDIWNWVKPGDLIVTTAFAIKDDALLQEKLIRELAARGCAGLGIKTKRFLPEIPLAMCKIADEYNLPILELPLNLSLAEIINSIASSIATRQSYLLQRSNEIHKTLTKVAITGGGLNAIIECLGKLIQCPVACYDTNGTPLSSWLPSTIPDMDIHALSRIKNHLNNKVSRSDELQKRLSNTTLPFTASITIDDKAFLNTSFAIMSSNEFFGHISILQISDAFLDLNCLALEHTCTVAALDFLKQKAVSESRRLHSRDMLDRILIDDVDNQTTQEIIASSKLGQAKDFRCIVIELDDAITEVNVPVINTKLYKSVQNIVSAHYPCSLVSERAGKIIALTAATQLRIETDNEIFMKIQKSFHDIFSDLTITIGVGTIVNEIIDIRQSYHDAITCINYGRRIKGSGKVIHSYEIAGYSLLAGPDTPKILSKVCNTTINKLEKADKALGMDLIKTLEKYLECDKNCSETAKELYVHRNTLSNRLERISEIGEIDFNNREQLFCLRLGLRQRKFSI